MQAVEFTLTEHDVVRSTKRVVRRRLTTKKVGRILIGAIIAVLVAIALLGIATGDYGAIMEASLVAIAFVTAITLIFVAVIPVTARRHYRQMAALHGTIQFEWDSDRVRMASSRGTLDMNWSDFVDWDDTGDLVFLFQSDQIYNLVPTRSLTQDQADDLRSNLPRARNDQR
jgi:hypothetical protein